MNQPIDTERQAPRRPGLLREMTVIVLVALALSALVRVFLVQAFFVPSGSMEPTLYKDDRILVSKIDSQLHPVERGDVIVFVDPGGWLPEQPQPSGPSALVRSGLSWLGLLPADSGHHLVKRVIGQPGDHVVCCDARGRITVNGTPLDDGFTNPAGRSDDVRFDITVPDGRFFVMGDNRSHSADSRFHLDTASGTVPADLVVGRVVAVVWPLDRTQSLSPPPTFGSIPAQS